MVAYVGLPSLIVTLAGLIGYRGFARVLVEDRSIGGFPDWFNTLGQQPLFGPITISIAISSVMFIILDRLSPCTDRRSAASSMSSATIWQAARYSGVRVRFVKMASVRRVGYLMSLLWRVCCTRRGWVRCVATGRKASNSTLSPSSSSAA